MRKDLISKSIEKVMIKVLGNYAKTSLLLIIKLLKIHT
jgi:hypothetical protein